MEKKGFFLIALFLILIPFISAPFGYDNPTLPKLENPNAFFGNFTWNGGWESGGVSIIDGDIYVQTGYFYKLTSLNITQQNLTITENLDILGDLSVDTDTLFVDSVNNRIGIGTVTPNTKLHVAGAIFIDGEQYNAGVDNLNSGIILPRGYPIYSEHGTSLRNLISKDTSDHIDIGQAGTALVASINLKSGNAGYITLIPGGGEAVRVLTTGEVGIGTSSPDAKFHVNGSAYFGTDGGINPFMIGRSSARDVLNEEEVRIWSTDSTLWFDYWQDESTAIIIHNLTATASESGTPSHSELYLDSQGVLKWDVDVNPFVIDTDGKVGIGETSPDSQLELSGINDPTIHLDGLVGAYIRVDKAAATREGLIQFETAGTDTWFMGSPDSDLLGDGDEFFIGETNSDPAFVMIPGGNVGIGTVTPNTKLHVAGAIFIDGEQYNAGVDNLNSGIILPRGYPIYSEHGTSLRNLISKDTSDHIDIGQAGTALVASINLKSGNAGYITLIPGGGEAVRVLTTGEVGIGTSSPQNLLNVLGDGNFTGNLYVGGNLTLGQKITFAFGEIIDNIVDGWITITGNLDVTGNTTITGDLNVTGRIYNSITHAFGLSTIVGTVASADTWYNITMNRSHADASGFAFSPDNITMIVPHDGHYTLTFGMGISDSDASPDAHVGMRIALNGAELKGSYIEEDTHKQDIDIWVEHTTHAILSEGDKIQLQYISSATTVTIEQDDTYATQGFNAFGYLQEVMT